MIHLYRAAWWVLGPLIAVLTWLHPRTRVRWTERWSLSLPAVEPGCIVVHAASLGEGVAAHGLLEALRSQTRRVLLRTATSDTGLGAAKGHHALAAWPMDHPWVVRRWLDHVRPSLICLVEPEIWPTVLALAGERGIPIVGVPPRSGPGRDRVRRLFPALTASIRGVDADGLKAAAPPPEFDQELPRPALVAGSTRGEEAAVLAAWPGFLVLAPRYPERLDLSVLLGRRVHRRSAGPMPAGTQVLLLDTHGELAGAYAQADVAFVGGTFDPAIGGHAPSEALAAGARVVHGPETQANAEAFDDSCVLASSLDALGPAFERALELGRVGPRRSRADAVASRVLEHLGDLPAERPQRPGLAPLAWVWGRLGRPRGGPRSALPVVSVGNLASGGTGKTPVVREVCQRLRQLGATPAVVSRGYGRGEGADVRTEGDLGDELEMLADEVLVVSAPDRVAGVARAQALGATVAVLDDGFHSRIHREVDILVVDGVHPDAGGPIPVGERRPGEFADADLVWATRGDAAHDVASRLVPDGWPELGPVAAFAGIHRPGRFLELLVQNGVDVRAWEAFPDHHRYTDADVRRLTGLGLPLVTTEKDAPRFVGPAQVLRVRLELLRGHDALDDLLRRAL